MLESTEAIKKLLTDCSVEEQEAIKRHLHSLIPHPLEREWNVDSDTILSAIRRSSDITKRGMRGIIAEAVFERSVLPLVESAGWKSEAIVGDMSYDVRLTRAANTARIQIKLQRLNTGKPLFYYSKHYPPGSLYVVEVQKTRGGKRKARADTRASADVPVHATEDTRPYSFKDFDILAVNMHPSSGKWNDFRYTVASWLLPRTKNVSLIEIMQPVAATPNEVWTGDLIECLEWLRLGERRQVLTELLHRKVNQTKPAGSRKSSTSKTKVKTKGKRKTDRSD